MTYVGRLRNLPPWSWVVAVGAAGLVFLLWHSYANNDDDTSWTGVDQPPTAAEFPTAPPFGVAHGSGRPLGCCPAFRGRRHPGVLDVNFGMSLGGDN
jgi:hypothetical protein